MFIDKDGKDIREMICSARQFSYLSVNASHILWCFAGFQGEVIVGQARIFSLLQHYS